LNGGESGSTNSSSQHHGGQSDQKLFESTNVDRLLKIKLRTNIYDLKESDFMRIKGRKSHSSRPKEELDEYFEEIGDIDPKLLQEINEEFERDLLKAESDTFWCLSKIIDDIQDNYTEL